MNTKPKSVDFPDLLLTILCKAEVTGLMYFKPPSNLQDNFMPYFDCSK